MLAVKHAHILLICRTFEWLDERKGSSKKLSKTPAKQFIDSSLTQIQKQLEDESIFPTKFGEEYIIHSVSLYPHDFSLLESRAVFY